MFPMSIVRSEILSPSSLSRDYSFGTTERALARLRRLADLYEPSSRVFLVRLMGTLEGAPRRVADLGSGPGRTTRLLAEILEPAEIVGFDEAPSFLEAARRETPAFLGGTRVSFERYRVGSEPSPLVECDVVYARHLAAHLPNPGEAFAALARAGFQGAFALEEVASLESESEVFSEYYDFVRASLAARGQDMEIGQRLFEFASDFARPFDFRVVELALDARRMATLHLDNLHAFVKSPEFDSEATRRRLQRMKRRFEGLLRVAPELPPVTCRLGQLIVPPAGHVRGRASPTSYPQKRPPT